MHKEVSCLAVLVILILGCNKEGSQISKTLTRLESESPVDQKKLKVSNCKIDGDSLDNLSHAQAKRGEELELTGTLSPHEWNMAAMQNGWNGDGESPRAVDIKGIRLSIAFLIHGNDIAKRFGVVEAHMIEARPFKDAASDFEFRVRFKAPVTAGKYVMDLQAADMAQVEKDQGRPPTKPVGFPIWRKEIWVD